MAGDHPAHEGENPTEIQEIQSAKDGIRRFSEFENHQATSRFEDPGELPQAPGKISQIPDPKGHHGPIEMVAGKGLLLRIATNRENGKIA